MFAAKQGFYTTSLGGSQSPFWVCVFDDFVPEDIDINGTSQSQFSLLAGRTSSGGNKGCVVRLDNYGNVVYQKQLTGAVSVLNGIKTDSSGFGHVIGETDEDGITDRPYIAVTDASGDLVWEKYISDVTSGTFNDIAIQQDSSTGDYYNIVVGRSNSTSTSQFMSFKQSDGTLANQQKYGLIQILYSVTARADGLFLNTSFNAGLETGSATDDVSIVSMDDTYSVVNQILISDSTSNLGRPSVLWTGGQVFIATRAASGTYASKPYLLATGASLGSPTIKVLSGTITSSGMFLSNQYVMAATQTNNTVWFGQTGPALGSISNQRNFYFGSPGTDVTSVNGIAKINDGTGTAGIYIIGQTDYYGASKGYVARLPQNFSIPGTGTYGTSGEIHLTTTSYMSISTPSTISVTTPSVSPSTTGFTDTTSTLTQTAGTDTTTLTQIK